MKEPRRRGRHDNLLKLKLCWCPKGSFLMGSPPSEHARVDFGGVLTVNEGPVTVQLTRGFWLGKYEVTQAQWQQMMGTTIPQEQAKGSILNLDGSRIAGAGPTTRCTS